MIIYVIDKTTNAIEGVYDNAISYSIDAGTITVPAGRGTSTVQLGENQVMAFDESSPDTDEDRRNAFVDGMMAGYAEMEGGA